MDVIACNLVQRSSIQQGSYCARSQCVSVSSVAVCSGSSIIAAAATAARNTVLFNLTGKLATLTLPRCPLSVSWAW